MDFKRKDPKSVAIRGLLKNEHLSKLLRDAFDAPVGTTSRKRARKVLSVVHRTAMDGRGGPGVPIPSMNVNLSHNQPDYSRLVIFPAAPTPLIKIGEKAPMRGGTPGVMDGAGGPGQLGSFGFGAASQSVGGQSSPLLQNSVIFGPMQQSSPQQGTSGGGIWDSIKGGLGRLVTPFGGQTAASKTSDWSKSQGSYEDYLAQNQDPSAVSPNQFGNASGPGAGAPGTIPGGNINFGAYQNVNNLGQYGAFSDLGGQQGGGDYGGGDQQQPAYGPGSSLFQQYPGLSSVQGAVNSMMGPSAFALQALQNPALLQSLPGMQGMQGGLLSERINDIKAAARMESHLDTFMNNFLNLQDQGIGLEGRLTDYIRGRDEFLNQTNGMLEDWKDKMVTTDMSDPKNRRQSEMYTNYLYELRGRQNKRYIEFLKTSIDEYNVKLNSAYRGYETALNQYQQTLERDVPVAQEEYQFMLGALTDMYNNVKNAPMEAMQMQLAQAQLRAAQMSAAKDAADLYGTNNIDISTYVSKLKNLGYITSDNKWNPGASIQDAETLNALGIPDVAFYQIMTTLGRNGMTMADDKGMLPGASQIKDIGGNLLGNLNYLAGLNPDNIPMAQNAMMNVQNSMVGALMRNGELATSKAQIVKDAANYLSTSSPGIFNWSKAPSLDQFLKKFEGSGLGSDFLNSMYADFSVSPYYTANRKQYAQDFLNYKDDDGTLKPYSDSQLMGLVGNSWVSKVGAAVR